MSAHGFGKHCISTWYLSLTKLGTLGNKKVRYWLYIGQIFLQFFNFHIRCDYFSCLYSYSTSSMKNDVLFHGVLKMGCLVGRLIWNKTWINLVKQRPLLATTGCILCMISDHLFIFFFQYQHGVDCWLQTKIILKKNEYRNWLFSIYIMYLFDRLKPLELSAIF
jgi:hypothetical protein